MIVRSRAGFILAAILSGACSERRQPATPVTTERAGSAVAPAESVPAAAGVTPAIIFLGTSLTAGYGLPDVDQAYPALIQRKLDSAGYRYRVVNAGISGETSAGALRRVDWVLGQGPIAVLAIETGANDGLRGQDLDSLRANIQSIIDRANRVSPPPKLIILGMETLPNMGSAYVRKFRAIYPDLARTNDAALVPFLLDRVAGVDSLNQVDGIHPTAKGQEMIAETVWDVLKDQLSR